MASTAAQLRDQARQAHAAGDSSAAARFMERAREAEASASAINVPEGSTLLKQYPDGGYITQDRKTADALYEPRGRIFNARYGNHNEHHPRGRRFQKGFGR